MNSLWKVAFGLIAALCVTTACDDSDDESISGFSLDTQEVTMGAEGGSKAVSVASETKWVAKVDQPWVKVMPANGVGATKCEIVVDTTLSNDIRHAVVTFIPEGQAKQKVEVHQTGYGKMIGLSEVEVKLASMPQKSSDVRYFDISVTTNVEFKISIPADAKWIHVEGNPSVSLDFGARPRTTKVRFNWDMNTEPEERIAAISFVPKKEGDVLEKEVLLNVSQEAAPKIEDNRQGDSLALLIIREKMRSMTSWDTSEKMEYWKSVTLWEKTDEGVEEEWVGRVRAVDLRIMNTKEELPAEFRHLKYLETLVIYGNTNTALLPDKYQMGSALANLQHLKHLTVSAFGITTVDPLKELTEPMKTLESLNLSSNNFTDLPRTITSKNFPNLTALNMGGMRRYDTRRDLRDNVWQENGGMRIPASRLEDLFKWDNLKILALSYGYIYGELPAMKSWNTRYYTAEQIAANDTLNSASDADKLRLMTEIPCVLPNLESLSLNLNFFTGKVPDWLLYHPRFARFSPYSLLFPQEDGYDRNGNVPGFTNEPENLEYFYEFYPAARPKKTEE